MMLPEMTSNAQTRARATDAGQVQRIHCDAAWMSRLRFCIEQMQPQMVHYCLTEYFTPAMHLIAVKCPGAWRFSEVCMRT